MHRLACTSSLPHVELAYGTSHWGIMQELKFVSYNVHTSLVSCGNRNTASIAR